MLIYLWRRKENSVESLKRRAENEEKRQRRELNKDLKQGYNVLSAFAIWSWAAVIVFVAVSSVWTMLYFFGDDPKGGTRLEAIRIASTVVVGTGGGAALLLTARRQRFMELDGTERRITDIQTKAVDQLGHERAAVRLAGMYGLERLAQDHPGYRQTVVNIICAYLRMPFSFSSRKSATPRLWQRSLRDSSNPWKRRLEVSDPTQWRSHDVYEEEVRRTAQGILADHLYPDSGRSGRLGEKYWRNIDVDLRYATLIDFRLGNCRIGEGDFRGARFIGMAIFVGANFESAYFDDAVFCDDVNFSASSFRYGVNFFGTTFKGDADFSRSKLGDHAERVSITTPSGRAIKSWPAANFPGAQFRQGADFRSGTHDLYTDIHLAEFAERPLMDDVQINLNFLESGEVDGFSSFASAFGYRMFPNTPSKGWCLVRSEDGSE